MQPKHNIIGYSQSLKEKATRLRKNPTQSEKLLWQKLRFNQTGFTFSRQKPIGYFIYDFYCKELKLLIELDGFTHALEETKENDKRKEEYAKGIGFTLLRFQDDEIYNNLENVVNNIIEIGKKNLSADL